MPQTPPPYALPTWADGQNLYVQLPRADGEPVTLSFPLSSGGLTKALPYFQKFFETTPRPVAIPARAVNARSEQAKAVLRRLGMIG